MKKGIIVLGIAALLLSCSNAYAMVIFSDNFDLEAKGLNYTSFANWNVSDGTVDVIGNGYYDFYPGNGLYVDLDGSTNNAGKMTTKSSFGPGSYVLEFVLAGSTRDSSNTVTVSLGSYSETFTLSKTHPWTTYSRNVAISGSPSYLIFDHAGGDKMGIILDNVKLTMVPEPASLSLLGLGLLSLLGIRGRKK